MQDISQKREIIRALIAATDRKLERLTGDEREDMAYLRDMLVMMDEDYVRGDRYVKLLRDDFRHEMTMRRREAAEQAVASQKRRRLAA